MHMQHKEANKAEMLLGLPHTMIISNAQLPHTMIISNVQNMDEPTRRCKQTELNIHAQLIIRSDKNKHVRHSAYIAWRRR